VNISNVIRNSVFKTKAAYLAVDQGQEHCHQGQGKATALCRRNASMMRTSPRGYITAAVNRREHHSVVFVTGSVGLQPVSSVSTVSGNLGQVYGI